MKPVLLIDMYVEGTCKPHFTPYLPDDFVSARPMDEVLPDPRDFSAIVLSGSAGSLNEPESWMDRARDFTREAIEHEVPTLGVCFGHQLIAYTLGGADVLEKARPPEVGYFEVTRHIDDPVLGALPQRFTTFITHEDQVRPSPHYELLASSARCATHALRVPGKPVWGVQFHTEYPFEEQLRIIEYRVIKHAADGFDREEMLTGRVDTAPLARALFGRFIEMHTER